MRLTDWPALAKGDPMARRSRLLIGVVLALLIAGGAAAALLISAEQSRPGSAPRASIPIGGPFTLTAADGKSITDQTYRGKWLLVYFGYTSCFDECPEALKAVSVALEELGPVANRVQPLFITLDPKRDTPTVLARYMKAFDKRIVGLTGTPEQIARVAREYRVYYAPENAVGGGYVINHSTFIYVVSPRGTLAKFFAGNTSGVLIADELRQIVKHDSSQRKPRGRAFFTYSSP